MSHIASVIFRLCGSRLISEAPHVRACRREWQVWYARRLMLCHTMVGLAVSQLLEDRARILMRADPSAVRIVVVSAPLWMSFSPEVGQGHFPPSAASSSRSSAWKQRHRLGAHAAVLHRRCRAGKGQGEGPCRITYCFTNIIFHITHSKRALVLAAQ